MAWLYLLIAGLMEVAWATGLKLSQGFTRPGVVAFVVLSMTASIWLLALAMRQLPLGTAYPIWTGIGAVGAFVVGLFAFGESLTMLRVVSLGLIIAGIAGLSLAR